MANPSEETMKEIDKIIEKEEWESDLKILEEQGYYQLCVWGGVTLDGANPPEFEEWFLKEVHTRIRFAEVVLTKPDRDENGVKMIGTGNRSDIFFYVHQEDIPTFSVNRLNLGGCRWWEDILSNGGGKLYSTKILEKYKKRW
jgi:hypothetical protein